MTEFFSNLEIIDTVSNPFGIYKHCRAYSEKIGKHYYIPKQFEKTNKDGSKVLNLDGTPVIESVDVYERYENTSNEHVIVVVDHISLLSQEKQFKSWYETIEHYSTEYCRKQMSKHWGFTVVNIQQQASDKDLVCLLLIDMGLSPTKITIQNTLVITTGVCLSSKIDMVLLISRKVYCLMVLL